MKILVLSNEVWNDKINGNNVTTNWFSGMNADFANIYASPESPYNSSCNRYFQITDKMMFKSIFTKKKAGQFFCKNENSIILGSEPEKEPKKIYAFFKKISGGFVRFMRELLWLLGKYDIKAMKKFIQDFQPDVIFSERRATCKMLRLEKVVSELCDAPFYAFTGDDEYSLKQLSFSPFFWINRFMVRRRLKKMQKRYKIYYTMSNEQKDFYERILGCKCKILHKCGELEEGYKKHEVSDPIKLIYAGKFYCNRWKVLRKIAKVLKEINNIQTKAVLEIYTKDIPNKKQNKFLNDGKNSIIKGPISQERLLEIYKSSDVALHVESDDMKNRLLTRFSFSTKIIDCMFSGCAVLAYCWKNHSGLTYLKKEDAAICVSSVGELKEILIKICNDHKIVEEYSQKAFLCAKRNHIRKKVQEMLLEDFRNN